LSIGCAGGIDTNTSFNYEQVAIEEGAIGIEITVNGLVGGHSGMDIDKGRGNAKLINRVLYSLKKEVDFQLISFDGGSLRNAIPREAVVVVAVKKENQSKLVDMICELETEIKEEFKTIEAKLVVSAKIVEATGKAVSDSDAKKIINTLYATQNGVFRMSPDIEGLVECSSSLARVIVKDGEFITKSLQRSSVESSKTDIANTLRANFENMGCEVVQNGDYPGWQPNPNSAILNIMKDLYVKSFNEEPQVKACHAGLECGILGEHLPGVDMISFGPNIRAPHSPDEKVQISSVQKFWGFLLDTLKEIPLAN